MRHDHLLVAAAGASILFTQHIAVREIGSTFFSTELVLIVATATTLAGPSIGYAVARRISERVLVAWGAATTAAQIALPVGLRALVGAMAARGLEGPALGATAIAGGLVLSGFYAVFLPRRAAPISLPALYAAELAGALAALALIALSPSYRITIALGGAAAVVALHLGLRRRALTLAAAFAAGGLALAHPRLDRAAAAAYFEGYHGRRAPVVVETEVSPYQRIDVVDDARMRRSLYLDGVPFFRSGGFDAFNVFLAEVPGALRPGRGAALVVGSGSFSSAALLRRLGYDVTVVELDAAVARIGFARFAGVHRLREGDVRLEIADVRRFLARTQASFEVIALDVPAPYHVRTALLHTPSFYRLAASRLRPEGVLALSLCGGLRSEIGRAVIASAAEVFPSMIAVEPESSGIAILYAGSPLPFSADGVVGALSRDPRGGRVQVDAELRAGIAGVQPLREDRLAPVLALSRRELEVTLRGH